MSLSFEERLALRREIDRRVRAKLPPTAETGATHCSGCHGRIGSYTPGCPDCKQRSWEQHSKACADCGARISNRATRCRPCFFKRRSEQRLGRTA